MKTFIGVIMAFFLVSGVAIADTATVNISPPATRTNGTAFDPTGATYTFYRSPNAGGPFDTAAGAIAEPLRSITYTLEAAPFYVCFTTTDTNGLTGDCSVSAQIPAELAPPGAGTIDSVTVTITIP